jgi:hypothetical protein
MASPIQSVQRWVGLCVRGNPETWNVKGRLMYYKEIPRQILEKLQKPLEAFTEEAVTRRFDTLFQGRWKCEYTHKQLFALNLPMIGPRGMEVLTTIPIWLIESTITVTVSKDEQISRTSYVITPLFSDDDRKENEKLSFINTALRGFSAGMDEKKLHALSLEKDIIGRKVFVSEHIHDYVFDVEAVKVILAKEEEEGPDRRNAPRKTLPTIQSVPVMVTLDRRVIETDIFLLDFSSSGLKIITTFDFPKDKPFTLTLRLDEPLSLWCEVVWKNALWEELNYIGIKFVKLHLDKFEKLCRFVEDKMPRRDEGGLKVSRVLPMELALWDQPKRLPTFFHSLSPEEMRILFPSFLKEGLKTVCRIFPLWNVPPIEGEVEVISSLVLKEGGCLAVLAFRNMSAQSREMLQGFLQKCTLEERHRNV